MLSIGGEGEFKNMLKIHCINLNPQVPVHCTYESAHNSAQVVPTIFHLTIQKIVSVQKLSMKVGDTNQSLHE